MDSQKIENLLNLALDANVEERDKSLELNVGFDKEDSTWELIVKYNGDLNRFGAGVIQVEKLLGGYAIVTIPQSLIDSFAQLEEVEYIEKPKRLFFALQLAKEVSCILPITVRVPYLSGKGTIIAVIDSGIDYARMDFRMKNGNSRILALWDQTITPDEEKGFMPPEGFVIGTEFSNQQINEALEIQNKEEQFRLLPSIDTSGHGSAVAEIAAGNGFSSRGRFVGVAPECDLLVVKLGTAKKESFPRTTELMRALSYVVNKAIAVAKPLAINLSFGNTYGAHDGTSLVERFINNVSQIGKNVICVGSGNEGAAGGHVAGVLGAETRIELAVAEYERTVNVQLWKEFVDDFQIYMISPGGEQQLIDTKRKGTIALTLEETEVLIYVGEPSPYSISQEIYFDMIPVQKYINSGVWTFRLVPIKNTMGNYYFYLPSSVVLNTGTRFYTPTPEVTFTIPSTAEKVITVGAYNSTFDSYADFSGRGYLLESRMENKIASEYVKPDLVAPGVNIAISNGMGGTQFVTGTSFATPFVTGSASLMMEWGIVAGNDPYLYGEKVKAYLRKGARKVRGEVDYPNPRVGYGALCVADSLPL